MWCFRSWHPRMTKGYLYGCSLRVWDVRIWRIWEPASVCSHSPPPTHSLDLIRSRHVELTSPGRSWFCTDNSLSTFQQRPLEAARGLPFMFKISHLQTKSIRSVLFFNRQKCTYFKISHSNKFLRWFKKKHRVLKIFILREPHKKKKKKKQSRKSRKWRFA